MAKMGIRIRVLFAANWLSSKLSTLYAERNNAKFTENAEDNFCSLKISLSYLPLLGGYLNHEGRLDNLKILVQILNKYGRNFEKSSFLLLKLSLEYNILSFSIRLVFLAQHIEKRSHTTLDAKSNLPYSLAICSL